MQGSRSWRLLVLSGKNCLAVLPDDSVERNISFNSEQVQEVKKKLPQGKIGNLNISRIILGCNPIIAWSHARDLIYPNRLMKAYMTDDKILQTLNLAEQAGINTYLLTSEAFPLCNRYKKLYGSKLQTIGMTALPERDLFEHKSVGGFRCRCNLYTWQGM